MKIVFLTFSFELSREIDSPPPLHPPTLFYYRKDETLFFLISYLQFAFIFVHHIFHKQTIILGISLKGASNPTEC